MMSVKANVLAPDSITALGSSHSHLTHFQMSTWNLLCIAISTRVSSYMNLITLCFSDRPPDAPGLTPFESQLHSNSTPLTFMWGRRGVGLLIRATDIGTLLNRVSPGLVPLYHGLYHYQRIDVIVSRPLLVIGFTVQCLKSHWRTILLWGLSSPCVGGGHVTPSQSQ